MTTPLVQADHIFFKREDFNITGSVKDRSIPLQLKNLVKHGITKAVISSTGNAAISASHFANEYGIELTIFVSPKINPEKLKLISNAQIINSTTPISDAFKFSKDTNSFFLRQSTDPVALLGYSCLGQELTEELPQISSIFFPVGSGSTLVGVSQNLPKNCRIYAIQPACHPTISKKFDLNFIKEDTTVTDALGVKLLPLKTQIINTVNSSHGSGLVVQNQNVIDASNWLKDHNITTSPEGALALAGYFKAKSLQLETGSSPVIVLTGCLRH